MTTLHRIEEVTRPYRPGSGWNGPLEITLDNREKFTAEGGNIGGLVPVAGDFIEDVPVSEKYPQGRRVFQFYRVVSVRSTLRLSDGRELPAGHPHDVAPKEGDYFIRRTDGYRLVQRYIFEREYASALEALAAREELQHAEVSAKSKR